MLANADEVRHLVDQYYEASRRIHRTSIDSLIRIGSARRPKKNIVEGLCDLWHSHPDKPRIG